MVIVFAALVLAAAVPASAQVLPSEPIVLADGRLAIGGNVSATYSCSRDNLPGGGRCGDDTGFFNYTDYEHSALRMFRFDLAASFAAGERVTLLGEVVTENGGRLRPYALYVRVRPWPARGFAIQAGRVPPAFGAFARRTYPYDNLLIGYPLAYQYLTSLRADALPASADELLRMRGRGWRSSFSVGDPYPAPGVPLVSGFDWDTGVQAHVAGARAEAALSITSGTLANPRVGDDNGGRQVAGRAVLKPWPGLALGGSAARGLFVARRAAIAAGDEEGSFTQTTFGADVEYSRGHLLVRAEATVSDWRLPIVQPPAIELPLRAVAGSLEGRYKLLPGLYAAARLDHLTFSEVTGSARRAAWDAPVTRVEVGGGYLLQRNLLVKLSFQRNSRRETRVPALPVVAAQAVYWF